MILLLSTLNLIDGVVSFKYVLQIRGTYNRIQNTESLLSMCVDIEICISNA